MANVTMSLDELRLMEKNSKLLEQALLKEEALNKEIIQLKEEKIKILETNEKTVTIIEEIHVSESLMIQVPLDSLMNRLEQYFESYRIGRASQYDVVDEVKRVQDLFYTQKHQLRTTGEDTYKTVTHKGLDQIKKDIADEYKSKMTASHKREMGEIADVSKRNDKLSKKWADAKSELKMANSIISELEQNIKTLGNTIRKNNNRHKEEISEMVPSFIVVKTKYILNNLNWFNKRYALESLKDIWKKS